EEPPRLLEHAGPVPRVFLRGDGARIATVSEDGTARVWDSLTGQPVTPPLKHTAWLTWAAFSPDHKLVVTAGADRTARVWDAETGEAIATFLHAGIVNHVA